jgi:TonB family protein
MDVVSAVLVERSRRREALGPILGWSALAHAVVATIVVVVPASWLGARLADEPEVLMQISLGGAVGPRDGGLNTLGGRPIQQIQPVEPKKAIEPVRPPAAREPEMVEPKKTAPKKSATAAVDAKDPRSRTPTKGAQIEAGSTVAQTAGKGQGFGLTAGGGGTGGYLDVSDFCCPEYLAMMLELIQRNWSSRQGTDGTTLMRFVIERDGSLTGIQVERSSGNSALDYYSLRALTLTGRLPPLPGAYTGDRLPVHLYFGYTR